MPPTDGSRKRTRSGGQLALRFADSVQNLACELSPFISRVTAAEYQVVGALDDFLVLEFDADADELDHALNALRRHEVVTVGSHVYHCGADPTPLVPRGEIFVRSSGGIREDALTDLCAELGLSVTSRGGGAFLLQVTPGARNPVATAERLLESGLVEVAEPDLISPARLHRLPGPGELGECWWLENSGIRRGEAAGGRAGADARVVAAWRAADSLGSPEVAIAILDDGFDLEHPELQDRVYRPRDYDRPFARPSLDPERQEWHGTHCAGVAVAGATGAGMVGAAPGCRWIPMGWNLDLSDHSVETLFRYAVEAGARVISCSWGPQALHYPLSERQQDAIRAAAERAVICFSAGNDGAVIQDPVQGRLNGFAAHPDVLTVGASTSQDTCAEYSNRGPEVDVCAPSSGKDTWPVTTTDPRGAFLFRGLYHRRMGRDVGDYWAEFGGTSAACPLAAGICGLLFSVNPHLTAAAARRLLRETARKIGGADEYDQNGRSPRFGYGCIHAEAAVLAARSWTP